MKSRSFPKISISLILIAVLMIGGQGGAFSATLKPEKKKTPVKKANTQKKTELSMPLNAVDAKLEPFKTDIKESRPLNLNIQVEKPTKETASESRYKEVEKRGLSIGIKGGGSAGLSGAMGDVSVPISNSIELRGGVGYLTGSTNTSDNLKMATVNLDAIYSLNPEKDSTLPINVYLGGGFIYPWKVSRNQGQGAWGAHAYLGSKYLLQDNASIYGELAYTGIKYQADQTALRGVDLMMGYSYSF